MPERMVHLYISRVLGVPRGSGPLISPTNQWPSPLQLCKSIRCCPCHAPQYILPRPPHGSTTGAHLGAGQQSYYLNLVSSPLRPEPKKSHVPPKDSPSAH